jgi:CMP-N-acetylneuraminic acid synthetase
MIDRACAAGFNCAVTVTQPEAHPFKMLVLRDGAIAPVHEWKDLMTPRQQLPTPLRQNGAIYWLSIGDFLEHNTFFVPPIQPYEMSRSLSIDIDHPEDLVACEKLLVS